MQCIFSVTFRDMTVNLINILSIGKIGPVDVLDDQVDTNLTAKLSFQRVHILASRKVLSDERLLWDGPTVAKFPRHNELPGLQRILVHIQYLDDPLMMNATPNIFARSFEIRKRTIKYIALLLFDCQVLHPIRNDSGRRLKKR